MTNTDHVTFDAKRQNVAFSRAWCSPDRDAILKEIFNMSYLMYKARKTFVFFIELLPIFYILRICNKILLVTFKITVQYDLKAI